MKIKITYQSEDELTEILSTPLKEYLNNGEKLRKSDKYAPYKHAYMYITKRLQPRKNKSFD